MYRFPNPNSDIQNFIEVFTAVFEQYSGAVIDLDNMVDAVVQSNLASSSGHVGKKAISRSTRPDRSRDPLYNQMKMYSELFRALGWIRSYQDSALSFVFTPLGEQLIEAGREWRPLLGESILGIAVPNHVLRVTHEHAIRPFATILRTMKLCDNGLSRDEMIFGPLHAKDDRKEKAITRIANKIMSFRMNHSSLEESMTKLAKKAGIQVNTMRNYTRWPLAIMQSLDWTSKEKYKASRKTIEVHELTSLGKKIAEQVEKSVDIRTTETDELEIDELQSLTYYAHFNMLDRAGFDVIQLRNSVVSEKPNVDSVLLRLGIHQKQPLLFSPFQSLSNTNLQALFPAKANLIESKELQQIQSDPIVGRGTRDHLFVKATFVDKKTRRNAVSDQNDLEKELLKLFDDADSLSVAATRFVETRREDSQTEFYPLISSLFRIIGYESETSRAGANYQRWDGSVWLLGKAVPIEIKSPREELSLSTKALRQAVENKVILLSRESLPTKRKHTSLIVGYQIPNDRSELSNLIDDVYNTYRFNIGVLDLYSLVVLALRAITRSLKVDEKQLAYLRGFLRVDDSTL